MISGDFMGISMGFPSDVHGDSPATDLGPASKSRLRGQLRRELLFRLGGPGGLLGKMVEIHSGPWNFIGT